MADLALIKSNVAKMAAQNAPEADIDGYIASEGVSIDDIKSFKPDAVSKKESAIAGFKNGLITQPVDVVGSGIATLAAGGPNMGASFLDNLDYAQQDSLNKVGPAATDNPNSFLAGQIGGNIAGTALPAGAIATGLGKLGVLTKLPAAASILEGSGVIGNLGRGAIEGAASSLMLGQDPRTGAAGGAVGGGIAGGLGKLAKPISEPNILRQGMIDTLQKEGVTNLTPAQVTGSKALQNVEAAFSELPVSSGMSKNIADTQAKQFTSAVLKKAGLSGDSADEGTLNQIAKNLGQKFDDIANQTTVPVQGNQELQDALVAIRQKYSTGLDPDQKSVVYDYLNSIGQRPELTGKAYQQARSSLGAKAAGTNDSYLQGALMDIRTALDDAATKNMTPENAKAWEETNKGYRNFLNIQSAMKSNAGVGSEGNIPPQALLSAVRAATGNKFAQGSGDLNALARAGVNVLPNKTGNSGTAQRAWFQNLLSGGAGGLSVGALSGDPVQAGIAGLTGLALPALSGAAYYSPVGQAYLKNGIPIAANVLNSPTTKTIGSLIGSGAVNNKKENKK